MTLGRVNAINRNLTTSFKTVRAVQEASLGILEEQAMLL